MDIEQLINKLAPLVPAEVEHWRRVLDLGDPDMKNLIEKQVGRRAHQLLGNFREKLLLSLPPRSKARRSIHLGTVQYETEKWDFGITQDELLRNMGIFGMSGSGKTNLAFHLLRQLAEKGVPFLFWDWKRTARHLLPHLRKKVRVYTPGRLLSPFPFNPFIPPPGLEPSVYINHVVDVMADAYTLGDGSRSILQKAIAACYNKGQRAPTAEQILAEVDSLPGKERVRGWKISAQRALESLAFSGITGTDARTQEEFASSLLDSNTIIELDALSQSTKSFLIPLMCLWIYYVRLADQEREKLKLVIFVEEAHNILYRQERRAKESLMSMLLRQCREIGIGMIVIDQHPHLISTAAIGNAYSTLCLNQRDPSDMNKAAELSLVGPSEKHWFSMLPVGQAIVKLQGRWRRPFLIQVPHVNVQKGSVTDDQLARLMKGSLSLSGLRRAVRLASGANPSDLIPTHSLEPQAFDFLEDVIWHENDGVRTRYKRLGLSADKGTRLKNRLVESGVLSEQEVKTGRTYKVLLRITPQARAAFGLKKSLGRGSIAHEYWKRLCARRLRAEGYQTEFESPRPDGQGRVDILARKGPERLAVEIETGKSDVVRNVRQNLKAGFTRVFVAATDETALSKVERQLARAELLIPKRVTVALAGQLMNVV